MNNREKFLASAGEDREILAKVFDKAQAAERKGMAMFTSFLSEREFAIVEERKKHIDSIPYHTFGGYEGAGRVMLCFSHYEDEVFPIKAVRVMGRGIENLKHPDLLGSIMSLGLERKSVGDIVRGEGEWIIFCEDNIASYIQESLKEVGGVYTDCAECEVGDVKIDIRFEEITGTVNSLRADSVVSVMLKTSRSKAQEYIEGQKFYLNQLLCTKCDREIKENDILTVRHHGKARLSEISGKSKKGRIFITVQKYM
ncbi:MAG: hypothetical protein IKU60_01320 [Clostridia bacterium]|nr:hypothetical protein [Clostridia bacterium]